MEFTEKYLKFISKEFGISENEATNLSEDGLDDLYDKVCDLEVEEVVKADGGNGELSERGRIATEMVDFIWTGRFGSYPETAED